MPDEIFKARFEALTGHGPFPWQIRLYEEWFAKGEFPPSCSLPTGLGKTSVIAIWLIALVSQRDRVPRRLVYVVNRRTVVDQTTDEAEKLRRNLESAGLLEVLAQRCSIPLKANESPLAISTLRGQFADNREWSADPSRPAVICGTVDMIGSRLLFSGYRASFKTKPLYAGFLGQDALLIHDEAHLEPAFQRLLTTIEREQREGERTGALPWPKLRVMALSATSRRNGHYRDTEKPFELTDAEKSPPAVLPDPPTEPIHHIWRRLTAKKGIGFHQARRDDVANMIGKLARERRASGKAVLVFVRTIDDVKTVQQVLADKKEGVSTEQVQVLTGTVRGRERDRLATADPVFARFLAEPKPKVAPIQGTVYLVCTSAGEVGVDMSADHMVCDLTTLDSMAQRLGRVNRRGGGAAEIEVVYESDPDPKPKSHEFEKARWKTKELLERLPKCSWADDRHEGCPLELRSLLYSKDEEAQERLDEEQKAAFAPLPTILLATDILFDAWALTTIREKLPGRPPVQPYLHGVACVEPPYTYVAWREEVEVITNERLTRYKPEDLLEDYPLKAHELLRDRSDRVFSHLQALAKEYPQAPVWLVDLRDHVVPTTLMTLTDGDKNGIDGMTVLLPPCVGGLTQTGMLDGAAVRKKPKAVDAAEDGRTADDDEGVMCDVADEWYEDRDHKIHCRWRVWDDDPQLDAKTKGMRLVRSPIDTNPDADEHDERTGPRYWLWYTQPRSADDDLTKTFTRPIRWDHHTDDVTRNVERIVKALNLPSDLQDAVTLAAWLHDLGKKREVWQRSIGNPNPTDWHAKSGKDPMTGAQWKQRDICPDYRHEFGSLLDVQGAAEFQQLTPDMQEVVLHLIAAHHGRGRPHFPQEEAFDPDGDHRFVAALAVEVPRRFARLQRKYGRWGLAYLESLLRAADWAASASPSAFVETRQEDEA